MLSSYLDALLKLSSPQKLFDYDCVTLYVGNKPACNCDVRLHTRQRCLPGYNYGDVYSITDIGRPRG